MYKIFLIISLLFCGVLLQSCKSENAGDVKTEMMNAAPVETPLPAKNETQTVSGGKTKFKGVSFDYNPQIFGEGKVEEIAEQPVEGETDKPDDNYPKHISFTLPITSQKAAKIGRENPEVIIKVVPIKDFRRMFAISARYTEPFDKNLSDLRKAIKNRNFRVEDQIPILPFWDAHQIFVAKVKNLSFHSGEGIIFLTQYAQDFPNLINNEDLECIFQGITSDGENYILVEFPTTAAFLPESYRDGEFEGYKMPAYPDDKNIKQYEQYVLKITKRLKALPSDQFNPDLSEFEKIISSLKIEK